ncbi:MAG: hypothetical protein JWQ25_900, partial [Daejeonella sp.]|nr:hypothetical protein [Daejeonella sp.]
LTEGDRAILQKIISNQFRGNIFTYTLCSVLLIVGLYFFVKPRPLSIDNIQIQNSDNSSDVIVTDLDPVTVTWTSTGTDERVNVALENTETGKQSKRIPVQVSEGKLKFIVDNYTNYDKILNNRHPNTYNRIRAIIYAGSQSFYSKECEIKVGVKVIAYEELPDKIKFNAIIDQRIIDDFIFAPRLALFKNENFDGTQIFEATHYSSEPSITIPNPELYSPVNLVFTVNPQEIIDSKLIRTDVASLKDAILSLKHSR